MIRNFSGSYAFLSNFYTSNMRGRTTTVEHYFQAAKTLVPDEQQAILAARDPGMAKKLGRKATLRADWDEVKVRVMRLNLRWKFADPELRQRLISTYPSGLVEGNQWHDNFWGNCTCGRPSCAEPGQNNLGRLLMELRRELTLHYALAEDKS